MMKDAHFHLRLCLVLILFLLVMAVGFAWAIPDLTIKSSCGPTLMIQVPLPDRNYNGPTILEGDVYEPGVQVTVLLTKVTTPPSPPAGLPVTVTVMNPGPTQFWRWATSKVKQSGTYTAVITVTSSKGSTTFTSMFQVTAAKAAAPKKKS